jgi:hypothetical protein
MPGFAFKMDGRMNQEEEEGSIISQLRMMEPVAFLLYPLFVRSAYV